MEDPRERIRELSGNYTNDVITGILVGFAHTLKERDNWIDIITVREASDEIKALIKHHMNRVQTKIDTINKEISKG